jgi:hypothetical protein
VSGQTGSVRAVSFCVPTSKKILEVKNGVMTVAPSLFGVFWHKERQTKNKLLDFCPFGFSRFLCSLTVVAQFVSVHVPVLPGSK